MSIDGVQGLICASCGGVARRRDGMGRRRKLGTNHPDDILKLQVQRAPTLHDYSVTRYHYGIGCCRKLGRHIQEILIARRHGKRRKSSGRNVQGCRGKPGRSYSGAFLTM